MSKISQYFKPLKNSIAIATSAAITSLSPISALAEANLKNNFSEWLNGQTGIPSKDQNQAWNAGMYVLAYHSLNEKKVLI